MNHLKRYSGFLILLAAAFIPLACSDGEQEGDDTSRLKTFSFIIKTPTTDSVATNTRTVGDPGTAVDEEDVWDRLTVIVTFEEDATNTDGTKNSQKVFYKTISRSDFNSLSDYPGYEGYKVFEMNVPLGTAYLYGITYTKDTYDFETDIKKCTTNAEVQALTISNNYANGLPDQWSEFTSVATGFYTGEPTSETYPYVPALSNGIQPIEITENNESLKDKVRLLHLQRLAAKIDVQWDAADAYALGNNYTDVKVTDFTYTGGATDATDAGSGHLFPELNTEATALNGTRPMTNTTEISKRNGREYLYMFPDGKSGGTLSFNVTTKVNNATDATYTYTYTMPTLNRARWYKCHFTVNGNSGNSTTTEDLTFNGATQTTGD